ncbi:3-oxosteroid 1-dehydrogenase [Novosphingobium endophyticum]|uniref:3-oxosteroid 1-dehydrogenase n=1 Tax=Novosphingobium endophyticum TaxID=1955250 RepID=A0A916TTI4_9SPHN|nr:FAD-binding protein [Novosphingobium endophyticum]GGC06758.1 3-oxosteroid 1-dehydrogenase [Novosphingobium endophyticum]
MNDPWDKEVDVLVIGTGAGAMVAAATAAAHGAKTLIVEKSDLYGGTSATSGGGVWIPDSDSARAQGQSDSAEEAFTYIKGLVGNTVSDQRIRAFVDHARIMVRYVESVSDLRFIAIPYTDYQAEKPGGKMGYRSHETNTLHASNLPEQDFATMRPTHPSATLFGFIPWTTMEAAPMITRGPGWMKTMAKVLWRYYSDIPQRLRSRRSRFLVFGNAIAGHLKIALNRHGAETWLQSPLVRLIRDGEGAVEGAVIRHEGKELRVRAAKGVILGAGGFERNKEMRDRYLPGESEPEWSAGQVHNTGDAIRAGIEIGAALDLMDEAWWAPTVRVPGEQRGRPLFYERALPGNIIVNQIGERYMNEARSYDIAGKAMITADRPEARSVPSWIILDARFRRKYPMGPLLPVFPDWMLPRKVRSMYHKASSIADLARKMGVDPVRLETTVTKVNDYARSGVDADFGRGSAPYDRYYGDQSVAPNPNLAPIDKPPFYALRVYPGDIGTKGGLLTDEKGRVLDTSGRVIERLYAIGNNSASVMGPAYPGAGSTLAPAMTFGYLSALDAVGAEPLRGGAAN